MTSVARRVAPDDSIREGAALEVALGEAFDGRGGVVWVTGGRASGKSHLVGRLTDGIFEHVRTVVLRPRLDQSQQPFGLLEKLGWRPDASSPAVLVERLAAEPTVLVVDDAADADVPSRRVLARLGSMLDSTPVLIVLVSRRAPSSFPTSRVVELEPLDDRAFAVWLEDRISDPDLRGEIEQRSKRSKGGAIELLRWVTEVAGEAGPSVRSKSLSWPSSADAAFARRLDSLGSSERRLLELLAAVGGAVPLSFVSSAAEQEASYVRRVLELLEAQELVFGENEAGWALTSRWLRELLLESDSRERSGERARSLARAAEAVGECAAIRAHHRARADEPEAAARALLELSAESLERNAPDAAARAARDALGILTACRQPTNDLEGSLTRLLAEAERRRVDRATSPE